MPSTATIYDLDGRILRDNVRAVTRTARFLADRHHCSVIVEDWDRCRRTHVTPDGRTIPPPPDWLPASAMVPEPSLRDMRRDPVRFARELERHRIVVLARARDRALVRFWQRRQARLKRDAPRSEARLTATIAADNARRRARGHGPMTHATGIVAQLRARRIAQGLPLKVVAHGAGVTLAWLCHLERGDARSRAAELIERWARSLGAEVLVVAVATKTRPRKRTAA